MVRSLSRSQALLLGVLVVAGVGLSIYGLLVLGEGHWPWSKGLTLRVGFQDVKGVSPGTRVRIKGKDAGQVHEVRMPDTPDGAVILVLRLDDRFRNLIRSDARAAIASDGMFGGKVVEIDPGSADQPAVADNAEIASRPTRELADVVEQVSDLASSLGKEKGKLSEMVDNTNGLIKKTTSTLDSFQDNTTGLIKKTGSTLDSFQQVAEGVKELPFLSSRVKDPNKILSPAGCDRTATWFKQADLFNPGTDRLTASGEQKLKDLAKQLAAMTKKDGTEVVVTAFADSQGKEGGTVQQLTTNQCLVVIEFLRKHKAVHKDWGVLEHKITPLGLGTERPPLDDDNMPAGAGLGVVVFTPRSL